MNLSDLEAFGPDAFPDVKAKLEERRELFRIAAQSALNRSRNGATLEPEAREWAKHWAAVEPLGRPLSSGEPGGRG
jgi:hypothetical protein